MSPIQELQQYTATPLCRYESRTAAGGRTRVTAYLLAAVLDVVAAWMLLFAAVCAARGEPAWSSFRHGGTIDWAVLVLAFLTLLPMLWAIGLSASAIAGERESGTLDALLLTPISRRRLLWIKLLGRTAPPRRFMLATIPAYLCSSAIVTVYLGTGNGNAGYGDKSEWSWLATTVCVLLAALAVALIWGILFCQMHAVAAVGLWFSAKYQRTWTASLLTYLAILGPTVLLLGCGGIISLAWPMVLGPALFDELVVVFDERALAAMDQP